MITEARKKNARIKLIPGFVSVAGKGTESVIVDGPELWFDKCWSESEFSIESLSSDCRDERFKLGLQTWSSKRVFTPGTGSGSLQSRCCQFKLKMNNE